MTALAERSATLLDTPAQRTVFTPTEFGRLVDAALQDGGGVVQRVVYAEDVTVPHPRGWVPETVLVVTVCDDQGALYYRDTDGTAWISRNSRPLNHVHTLVFDDQAPANFPANAVLPLVDIRAAVTEYVEVNRRPTRIKWQEAERYLPW